MKYIPIFLFLTLAPSPTFAGGGSINVGATPTPVSVANGGTGVATNTQDSVLVGKGTGNVVAYSTFTLTPEGNVGIGTSSPGAVLDVRGNSFFGTAPTQSTVTAAGYFQAPQFTKTQIDTLVGVLGAMIVCSNCALPYDVCVGTGTAASQWMALGNSAAAAVKGCGSGN